MTADFSFFAGLDEEQRAAASLESNAAVGAGAGSGKTRSLAARYLWLIMRGCKVEEILTITFMNKAANEMYSRIYQLLAENAVRDPRAALALEQFHRANIHTLDSFCAAVARTASRRFGVSPDFKSDNEGVRELARQTALRFVLDKRDNPALQRLIAEKKIRTVAEELFAEPLLRYGSLSRALDFEDFKNRQRAELLRRWEQLTGEADRHIRVLRESLDRGEPKNKFYENLLEVFKKPAPPPGMKSLFDRESPVGDPGESPPETAGSPPPEKDPLREQFAAYFEFLRSICQIRMTSSAKEEHRAVKEARAALKDELYPRLEAAANTALQWDIVVAVYPLMAEFQELFNNKKRETGILSFADIARLALDALSRFPDIRRVYKESIKKIMIDEFQDNNSL
ncbi:MAG: UvrD-helicase domain-containing protein, partial [Treponema sp.]|nr:UvrD-helicase domain-containing protein [Treponema sp.]